MVMTDERLRRVLAVWAEDAVAFARVLAAQDPSWRTEWFPLGGGSSVLCGRGLYVNRLMGAGIERSLGQSDLELLERRCAVVGVAAAVETTPATHPGTVEMLVARGYDVADRTSALGRALTDGDLAPSQYAPLDPTLSIERADGDLLPLWQETSASGWGHRETDARRASDAFARAAAAVDGEHFVLVRSVADGRPVAAASLTMRSGVATLGGMSTVPGERGRGVQSALIRHRLRAAQASGCDLATSTAEPGSGSERNLMRHGFEPWCTIETWIRKTPADDADGDAPPGDVAPR